MPEFLLGTQDMRDLVFPPSLDIEYLEKITTATGITYPQFANALISAIVTFNSTLLVDHRFLPGLTYPTSDATVLYGEGSRPEFGNRTELTRPPSFRAKTSGHMLPMADNDMGISFTLDWLKRSITSTLQITQQIRNVLTAGGNLLEKAALDAFFRNTDKTVASTGKALPLVGGGAEPFTPQSHEGKDFDSNHNHFLRFTEAEIGLACATSTEHLKEHGHTPRWECFVSDLDRTLWQGVSDDVNKVYFVPNTQVGVIHNTVDDRTAELAGFSKYIGSIQTPAGMMWLLETSRLPSGYFGVYRSYGQASSLNPVAWRFVPESGLGLFVESGMLTLGNQTLDIIPRAANGLNIGTDRTNGVCTLLAPNGNYISPIIS
jgi:hypothetical protein